MLFNKLTVRETIKVHGLYDNFSSRGWDTEERSLMRAAHSEAGSYFFSFNHQFVKNPLNIRKACSHHSNDC